MPHLMGISERTLTLVDEILIRTAELRMLQEQLLESNLTGRRLTLLNGGSVPPPDQDGSTGIKEVIVL